MGTRLASFSQLIEQERRRWAPFRRALSKEDQEVFDRLFACAVRQLQADVRVGRPWRFEAALMAVLLEHERRIERLLRQFEERTALDAERRHPRH